MHIELSLLGTRDGDENVIKNDISIAIAFKLTASDIRCVRATEIEICTCIALHCILCWTSYATLRRKSGRRIKTKRSNQRYCEMWLHTDTHNARDVRCSYVLTHSVCDFILNKYTDHSFTLEPSFISFHSISCVFLFISTSFFCFSLCVLVFAYTESKIYRSPIVWPPAPFSQSECTIAFQLICCFNICIVVTLLGTVVVCHQHLHAVGREFWIVARFRSILWRISIVIYKPSKAK